MSTLSDAEQLRSEHAALLQAYGRVQADCSLRLRRQAERIGQLENALFQARLAVVLRDTRKAWDEADQRALREAAQLPRRKILARQVEQLMERVRSLARQRSGGSRAVLCVGGDDSTAGLARQLVESTGGRFLTLEGEEAALEASLRAADLVICQTGCISHDAYWRVRDHCKRTGKQCVLVDSPVAVVQPPASRKPV
ncbi:DUF2325 domain-containing protein [Bordetella pseudohinzii]|uniref:Uncharacterized protein conserved in bacteria (DUF2325) n=1 Tax=Bordetella pseudohinzii TaxID=1331258 RepID=A0A0J6EX82_9BORD|nr:DUF2325 domain-containing protein [Bordetella pseudohinzii]ANY17132.1 hypothetical protein BBN53_15340 [Bordetella pseudohinzii]KMM24985.1 hypothetical protein L540_03920 [Bordetella pseudohinzii]KXA77101.1 hypothetical protein AW877_15260 [Bordetella pseudohinzii]KXA80271.1 hypothetical protein AW878_08330 [Bordetella pseudohinzii]CUI99273.1 Uncharacterized protein conserved in bacteria (DUF2325) [Bordetella pseudohinzii]